MEMSRRMKKRPEPRQSGPDELLGLPKGTVDWRRYLADIGGGIETEASISRCSVNSLRSRQHSPKRSMRTAYFSNLCDISVEVSPHIVVIGEDESALWIESHSDNVFSILPSVRFEFVHGAPGLTDKVFFV